MKNGFFITGTGTGVGKTFFTAGFLSLLRRAGINAAPLKTVQTGSAKNRISPDLSCIFKASGFKPEKSLLKYMQPFAFSKPCSPHLACELDNKPPACIPVIIDSTKKLLEKYDMVLAEGAGGVLVPVDRKNRVAMIDLMAALGLPIIVVAHAGLGTINHTCLTLEALKHRNLAIAGFVLNNGTDKKSDHITEDNAKVIEEFTGIGCLGTLVHVKNMKNLLAVFEKLNGLEQLVKGAGHGQG